MKVQGLLLLLALVAVQPHVCRAADILYVNVDAPAGSLKDGSSWANAFVDLNEALAYACAQAPDAIDIWVATGTYIPSQDGPSCRGEIDPDPVPMDVTFCLCSHVALHGGFSGTETTFDERDPELHPTVLSGERVVNDPDNNAFHVITARDTDSSAVMDGFVISGGNSTRAEQDDQGSGIYVLSASPVIRNCRIAGQFSFWGGGAYVDGGSPRFEASRFELNFALAGGGGMYVAQGDPTLLDVAFVENSSGGFGGGLYVTGGSAPVMRDCSVTRNNTNARGGGIYNASTSAWNIEHTTFDSNLADSGGAVYSATGTVSFISSIFRDNYASWSGGALITIDGSSTIKSSEFIGNRAVEGAAVRHLAGALTVSNSTFDGNIASAAGGALNFTEAEVLVQRCVFVANQGVEGAALFNEAGRLEVRGTHFERNLAELSGGAIANDAAECMIVDSTFDRNLSLALAGDGGAVWNRSSTTTVVSSRFFKNSATLGGAIGNLVSDVSVSNSAFSGNTGGFGGAVFGEGGDTRIGNCTLYANEASSGGGTYALNGAMITITNSILWANRSTTDDVLIHQYFSDGGTTLPEYSCVEKLEELSSGNINDDPHFLGVSGADGELGTSDDDFRLQPGSPCHDAAANDLIARDAADLDGDGLTDEPLPVDLLGAPRRTDDPLVADSGDGVAPIVDMGVIEHVSPVRFVDNLNFDEPVRDGTSWLHAYVDLQEALQEAEENPGTVTAIWVAGGGNDRPAYRPASNSPDREATFRIVRGVSVYGGFSGVETALDQRSVADFPSRLSGDLNNDDGPDFVRRGDNSLHVVTIEDADEHTVLDGFIIAGGFANTQCSQCFTAGGGGISMTGGNAQVRNCRIQDNWARVGGGMVINSGEPTLVNCVFLNNYADGTAAARTGGAGLTINGGGARLANCRFLGNVTAEDGGGMYIAGRGNPLMVNCLFSGNRSGLAGAGLFVLGGRPTIINSTIAFNEAGENGGGMLVTLSGLPKVANSVFWGNQDVGGADESGQIHLTGATVELEHNVVMGLTGLLGGAGNLGEDPRFANPDGLDGTLGTLDDDFHLTADSACIDAGSSDLLPADFADLDRDGDTTELIPVDLSFVGARRVDAPAVEDTGKGVEPIVDCGAYEFWPDCNGNGVLDELDICPDPQHCDQRLNDCNNNWIPDECEIAADSTAPGGPFFCPSHCDLDCNNNGIPDACDVSKREQSESVLSTWIGTVGVWDDGGANLAWCLPEAPDNNLAADFDVRISGSDARVTLNTSPTVTALELGEGAIIEVNADSGASTRTLAADTSILCTGTIRATDRKRLVIDAPAVELGAGGLLEAADGTASAPGDESNSVVEINGSVVNGGRIETVGEHSEIHLIGGATLVDTQIAGVVVPDAQTGRFEGTVINNGVIRVLGEHATSRLEPCNGAPVLGGHGVLRLTSQENSHLGDFKTGFVNAVDHTIAGAGIVFGGLENLGVIRADQQDGALIITAPGQKVNHGRLEVAQGATLRIHDDVEGDGELVIDGGVVGVDPEGSSASLRVRSVEVDGTSAYAEVCRDFLACDGRLELADAAVFTVEEQLSLGGVDTITGASRCGYVGPPCGATGDNAAAIVAASVSINDGGVLLLKSDMSLFTGGDLIVRKSGTCDESRTPGVTALGGQTPPILRLVDDALANVAGTISIEGNPEVNILGQAAAAIGGDFDNRSTCAQQFDMSEATVRFAGAPMHRFEAAGCDVGPWEGGYDTEDRGNFSLASVEVSAGETVRFANEFPNTSGPCSCSEALYVHELVLNAGSSITLDHCRVYYDVLIDDGATISSIGCGGLFQVTAAPGLDGLRALWPDVGVCLAGPNQDLPATECNAFDQTCDARVDLRDIANWLRCVGHMSH